MPGRLINVTPQMATGWASHPRLPDYRVVVNMVERSTIVRSVLADTELTGHQTGGPPIRCGFRIDLTALDIAPGDEVKLRFCIGETDEWIDPPDGRAPPRTGRLTVEDVLRDAHQPRRWVDGTTYLDALAAGLHVETIVDLLYRDLLGRPSDPNGLAHYSAGIRAGDLSYDNIRRGFLESDEFRMRRKYLDNAPGSIFSQKIVMAAGDRDAAPPAAAELTGQIVVASELARLDGRDFVAELYRQVLLKEVDEGGLAHYLHQLQLGVSKMDVIRTIAGELEAITAGVRVVGYVAEQTTDEVADLPRSHSA